MAENIIQDGPEQRPPIATTALGEGALMATEAKTATGDYLGELEKAYEPYDREKTYFIGCVDDREPTEESRAALVAYMATQGIEIADPIHEGYVRAGGGVAGMAKALATTIAIQSADTNALKAYNDFEGFMTEVYKHLQQETNVEGALHEKCAAASVGAVSEIAVSSKSVRTEGEKFFVKNFSRFGKLNFKQLIDGERDMAKHFFNATGEWKDYAVSPEAYAADPAKHIPVMQLEGTHANAQQTVFVVNADPHSISNPDTAIKVRGQAYNMDVTIAAELLMKAYPQLNLDPHILVPVLVHTAVAIRGALTGGQPDNLSMVVRGDFDTAFAHLDKVAADLKK